MRDKKWYTLDNIGKFYSSIASRQVQNVFRYSATIKDYIDEKCLQNALDETIELFPNFNVNLKTGVFWYYLDETDKKQKVTLENLPICCKLYNNSDDFLYRVSFYKNRINFEVSHILSDGRGSVEFFKVLISNYIKIKYELDNINIITDSSFPELSEDSFSKYYEKPKKSNVKHDKTYRYRGHKIQTKTRFMECHLSVSDVLNLSHKYNATITEFLVSVLVYSFEDNLTSKDLNKTIKIDIPVDLRSFYKSTSSKNFFGLTSITYKFKTREDSLDDIILDVKKQFKTNLTANKLSERANKMIAFEKNPLCRICPIFFKNFILKIIDYFTSNMNSTVISNIGKITLDKEIEKYIKDINVLTSTKEFQFTLCSFKNDLSIGISSRYKYNVIIKNFCRFFTDQNIKALVNVSEVD